MYQVVKNTAVDFESQYTEELVKANGCYYIPYCSAIANGDITGVQIQQDVQPMKAKALWDFASGTQEQWTAGANWSFATPPGRWVGTNTSTSLTYSSIIEPMGIYRLTFEIDNYSGGDLTPQIGTLAGVAVSGDGTFTQTIISQDATLGDLNLNGNTFTGEVSNICLEHLGYYSQWDFSASGWTTGDFTNIDDVMRHGSGDGINPLTTDILEAGEIYKIVIDIAEHSSGTLTISGGTREFGVIEENIKGTFTIYNEAQDVNLDLTPTNDLVMDIASIQVYKIYRGSLVGICNENCELVEFLNEETEYIRQTNEVLAVQVDWESHDLDTSNCYKLCYFDAEENCLTTSAILNQELSSSSYWVLPAGTSITASSILVINTAASDARVRNVAVLCQNQKYNVQFNLNMSGGSGGEYVIVNAGGTASAPFTSSQSVDIDITTAIGTEFNFQFEDDGGSIVIQNLIVRAVIDEATTPTVCSNCFQFAHGNSIYMTWNNTYNSVSKDAFGFRYKAYPTYINSYRMSGKLQNPTYPTELEYDVNDARDFNVVLADVKTQQVLAGSRIPNWLIRSLAMAVVHNNFQINGKKYVKLDGDVKITDLNCLMSNIEIDLTESGNKNVNV